MTTASPDAATSSSPLRPSLPTKSRVSSGPGDRAKLAPAGDQREQARGLDGRRTRPPAKLQNTEIMNRLVMLNQT